MGKYFGTDGIRGIANEELDGNLAYKTGLAVGTIISERELGERRARVIIGKDTRISGDMLESALTAGLCAGGVDVALPGVLPTPAVAYLTVSDPYDMGIVISASHNPYEHNGIKIFDGDGFKISDAIEAQIENLIDNPESAVKMKDEKLGRKYQTSGSASNYSEFIRSKLSGKYGGKIIIDCANGAASETAGLIFKTAGLNCEIISKDPNGSNINVECGSTHMERLCKRVIAGNYDIGIAFDGDADRCLAVDEYGNVVDGDMMLAIFAKHMTATGTLKGGGAVGTIVSNSGMDKYFASENEMRFLRADVGDRHVLELMLKTGCNLGGESSGHMIFTDDLTTGDGQLTAVKLINVLTHYRTKLSELVRGIPRYPQVMPSYHLTGGPEQRDKIMSSAELAEAIAKTQEKLKGEGRILIRPSGTESVIRVLVEAKTSEYATEIATELIELMKRL